MTTTRQARRANGPRPPDGWIIQEGAGGWRCVNRARLWSTNVYLEKAGGAAKAVEAAVELERKATARMEEIERLRVALRRCFRDNDNDN